MVEQELTEEQISTAIIDSIQIDEEGYKEVKVLDLANLMKLGIVDIPKFLEGVMDAENEKDFNDSQIDYVKGYKYGKTGKF